MFTGLPTQTVLMIGLFIAMISLISGFVGGMTAVVLLQRQHREPQHNDVKEYNVNAQTRDTRKKQRDRDRDRDRNRNRDVVSFIEHIKNSSGVKSAAEDVTREYAVLTSNNQQPTVATPSRGMIAPSSLLPMRQLTDIPYTQPLHTVNTSTSPAVYVPLEELMTHEDNRTAATLENHRFRDCE